MRIASRLPHTSWNTLEVVDQVPANGRLLKVMEYTFRPILWLRRCQHCQTTLGSQRHNILGPATPSDILCRRRLPDELSPALRRLGVLLHRNTASSTNCQELAGVIPANAINRAARFKRVDGSLLPDVPNRDTGRVFLYDGEPSSVFRKLEIDDGSRSCEFGHLCASLDVVDADVAVGASDEEKHAVYVERDACDLGFDVDLRDRLEGCKFVDGVSLVGAGGCEHLAAGMYGHGRDSSGVRSYLRNVIPVGEHLDCACRCSNKRALSPPCHRCDCAACIECLQDLAPGQ